MNLAELLTTPVPWWVSSIIGLGFLALSTYLKN